jgi:predicted transcriptional regulator of viral defense system
MVAMISMYYCLPAADLAPSIAVCMMSVGFKPTEVLLVARTSLGLPPPLARRANRVLRPRDATNVYEHPRAEFARLARLGVLRRLATCYYALVPQGRLGDVRWTPSLDSVALGVAQADYGPSNVALMGVSAARHHGAIPRALAVAVVAAPKQRPHLQIDNGRVVFVKRDVSPLDLERIDTQLVSGWVTTVEQTLLDLASRPTLGDLGHSDLRDAVKTLATKVDWNLVRQLAEDQHRPAALRAAAHLAEVPDARA